MSNITFSFYAVLLPMFKVAFKASLLCGSAIHADRMLFKKLETMSAVNFSKQGRLR